MQKREREIIVGAFDRIFSEYYLCHLHRIFTTLLLHSLTLALTHKKTVCLDDLILWRDLNSTKERWWERNCHLRSLAHKRTISDKVCSLWYLISSTNDNDDFHIYEFYVRLPCSIGREAQTHKLLLNWIQPSASLWKLRNVCFCVRTTNTVYDFQWIFSDYYDFDSGHNLTFE